MEVLDAISARRSVGLLGDPGPQGEDLQRILEAAVAAPDHGRLRPWRLVLLENQAKEAFGHVLADALITRCRAAGGVPSPDSIERERAKLNRAPLIVVVAALRRQSLRIRWEEQFASAAAAAQNILLAATALGYGSMWRTGDVAYDPTVKWALGLRHDDAVVGFLYIGTVLPTPASCSPSRSLVGVVERWDHECRRQTAVSLPSESSLL